MSIISGFGRLAHDLIHIAKRGVSFVGSNAYLGANGLHEKLTGSQPPGRQSVLIFPHDHADHGGVNLPRNNIFSFDDPHGTEWDIQVGSLDDYYRLERDGTSIEVGTADGPPNLSAYVSPGIDIGSTGVDGVNDCALEAKVLIYVGVGFACTTSVRFFNRDTGTYSTAQTTAAIGTLTWLTFDDIPCYENSFNSLDIEAACDTFPGPYNPVRIHSITLSETRPTSQPESEGTVLYTAAIP